MTAAVLSTSCVILAASSSAGAVEAVPTVVGWNNGAAVASNLDNTLVVTAPGSGNRVIEIAAERSPSGASTWTDVVNQYPYYSQSATSDQTNLPFNVPKFSFQGGYDYRVHARQWAQGDGANPSEYSAWLYFSVAKPTTKPVAPYPLFPRGETAPMGVILRADSSALPLSGQPINEYEFVIHSAHTTYVDEDSVALWSSTVAAPGAGGVAEAPVTACQGLAGAGLCSGSGNLINDSEFPDTTLRWRVRAKSAGHASSEWSRWRYFDTNSSQNEYWYVPNRAGSYQAGPQSGDEASALVASKQYPGIYWFIRDAGLPENRNKLYAMQIDPKKGRLTNVDGYTTKEFPVSGVDNVDWESLSIDDSGNIWIGDVGNFYRNDTPGLPPSEAEGQDRNRNSTSEPDLRLYRVPEPNPYTGSSAAATKTAPFKYPDNGEYNSESTFWLGGSMFLVTKASTGPQKVYRFPSYISSVQSENVLRYVGDLGVNVPPITDASVSSDNSRIALTSEGSRALIWEGSPRSATTSAEAEEIVKDLLVNGDPKYHYYYRSAAALEADSRLASARPQPGEGGQWQQTTMAIEGVAWQGDRLNMISEYGNHVLSVPRFPTNDFINSINPSQDSPSYWGWGMRPGSGNGLVTAPGNGSQPNPTTGEPTPSAAIPLPAGSTWNYRDTGVAPEGFQKPTYYGTGWKTGRAQLGAGDGDETTVINRNSPTHTTDYFRRSFVINGVDNYQQIDLRMVIDDGAVVYINGLPVAYKNMAKVTKTKPSAFATEGVYGAAESAITSKVVVDPPLVEGVNWIAVEVHQADATSSDTSFDLELRQHTNLPPATFTMSGSASNDGVTLEAQWSTVPGASEYRLYRRNLLSTSLTWNLAGTYTGTSGTYIPPDRTTEFADFKLTAVVSGSESSSTYGQRILFTQDPNRHVSDNGYLYAKGPIDVTTAPIPSPSAGVAGALAMTAVATADPMPADEFVVGGAYLYVAGAGFLLLTLGFAYVTFDGQSLVRSDFDADETRVQRAKRRAEDRITRYLQNVASIATGDAATIAATCFAAVAAAKAAGQVIPGADAWGLVNNEHPCFTMPIYIPGPRSSGGKEQGATYAHQVSALSDAPWWHLLTYSEHPATTTNRNWYDAAPADPRCAGRATGMVCDEFPYFTTEQGGPAGGFPNTGASLAVTSLAEGRTQGGDLNGFFRACNVALGEMFIVIPLPSIVQPVVGQNSRRVC